MSVSNLYPTGTTVENLRDLAVITAITQSGGFGTITPATLTSRLEVGKGFITCFIQLPANSCTITAQQNITFTLANNPLFDIDPIVTLNEGVGYCRFRNDASGAVQMVGVRLQATAGGIQVRTDDIQLTNTNAYTCTVFVQYPRA